MEGFSKKEQSKIKKFYKKLIEAQKIQDELEAMGIVVSSYTLDFQPVWTFYKGETKTKKEVCISSKEQPFIDFISQ